MAIDIHQARAAKQKAMGIDWMTRDEMAQAIPSDYSEFLCRQVIKLLKECVMGV